MVLSALCNIVYPCYHVTHKYALTWDSQLHSLIQGQLGITSADRVRRLWRQHVSSFFFLKLGGLRLTYFFLAISFFTQSQSATVYFFCTISYTVAVCDCVFLLYDFFLLLLSTLQSLISPTWLDRFWPDLVTSTGWPFHLCDMTRLGSKVT